MRVKLIGAALVVVLLAGVAAALGFAWPFGGKTTELKFADRIEELVVGHPHLQVIARALLSVRVVLRSEFAAFQKRTRKMAQSDARTRLLMSTPGVGVLVASHGAAIPALRLRPREVHDVGPRPWPFAAFVAGETAGNQGWFVIGGLLSIVFGVVLATRPDAGAISPSR